MSTGEDLDLLAQAYVIGDLDEATTLRFEARLADDQDARDAVARAVAITEALIERPSLPVPQSRSRRRWTLPLAAAAAVVLTIGITLTRGGKADRPVPASEDLIASWIEFGTLDSDLTDEDEALDLELSRSDLLDSGDTPSWLVNALEDDR